MFACISIQQMVKSCVFGGAGCQMSFLCVCLCGCCDSDFLLFISSLFIFFAMWGGKKKLHNPVSVLTVCRAEYMHWRLQWCLAK